MILLQLSAGQGPLECARGVALAAAKLEQEAAAAGVAVSVLERVEAERPGACRSVVYALDGPSASGFAAAWSGTLLWVCSSPYRRVGRKNWFLVASVFDTPENRWLDPASVQFETTRSSGAGGQHVNRTESAVRATHIPSGLSVRVESERSQHANKRLAWVLLTRRFAEAGDRAASHARSLRRLTHHRIERGNPVRCFFGPDFSG